MKSIVLFIGKTLFCIIVLAFVSLLGCASVQTPAAIEAKMPAAVSTTVRVAQMGLDCVKQDNLLKRILRDTLVAQRSPAPDKIELRPLSGSSLCGIAQGMANEFGTPELGGRNLAIAEVSVYWGAITYSELQRAHAVLAAMRPIHK